MLTESRTPSRMSFSSSSQSLTSTQETYERKATGGRKLAFLGAALLIVGALLFGVGPRQKETSHSESGFSDAQTSLESLDQRAGEVEAEHRRTKSEDGAEHLTEDEFIELCQNPPRSLIDLADAISAAYQARNGNWTENEMLARTKLERERPGLNLFFKIESGIISLILFIMIYKLIFLLVNMGQIKEGVARDLKRIVRFLCT